MCYLLSRKSNSSRWIDFIYVTCLGLLLPWNNNRNIHMAYYSTAFLVDHLEEEKDIICDLNFDRMLDNLKDIYQLNHTDRNVFDYSSFCDLIHEPRNDNGIKNDYKDLDAQKCQNGATEFILIFDYIVNRKECQYNPHDILHSTCETTVIEKLFHTNTFESFHSSAKEYHQKSIPNEIHPVMCQTIQGVLRRLSTTDITNTVTTDKIISNTSSSPSFIAVVELSYWMSYNPTCEEIYQDFIQYQTDQFFQSDSTLANLTYEIIHTNWIPFDKCLRNPVGIESSIDGVFTVGVDAGVKDGAIHEHLWSTMKCAMVTTMYHIIPTSSHQQHQQQLMERDRIESTIKNMFQRLINSHDFIHALLICTFEVS